MSPTPASRSGQTSPSRDAPHRWRALVPAALVPLLLLLGCAGGSDPASAPATTSTTAADAPAKPADDAEVVSSLDLTDRRFWYGDDEGSLFEATLDHAELQAADGGHRVELTGSAHNLLRVPAAFPSDAALVAGGSRYPLTTVDGDEVGADEKGALTLRSEAVPADLDLETAMVAFGADGTNQSLVPLDDTQAVTTIEPTFDAIGTPTVSGQLPDGATLAPTGSILYPRYGSDRVDDRRLELFVSVKNPGTGAVPSLFLHPSLRAPDGTSQSIGDQNVFPPGNEISESAILTSPTSGRYTVEFLEVVADDAVTFSFDLP